MLKASFVIAQFHTQQVRDLRLSSPLQWPMKTCSMLWLMKMSDGQMSSDMKNLVTYQSFSANIAFWGYVRSVEKFTNWEGLQGRCRTARVSTALVPRHAG
jgi:hypothetical protein